MNYLEGEALQWLIWTKDYYIFQNQTDFKVCIGQPFNDDLSVNIVYVFLDIKQHNTIKEYYKNLECLSIYLPPLLEIVLEETFMKGLKPDIQAKFIDIQSMEIMQLMEVAKKNE